MNVKPRIRQWLSAVLRPAFGLFLFLSQFTATRPSFFTENAYLLVAGIVFIVAGVGLCLYASRNLRRATTAQVVAVYGPYKYIRHPIYVSIYLLSIGLGCVFFAWLWFGVLLIFIPFWYVECKEEEHTMVRTCGQAYVDYQQRTGMFLPKVV